ncbi:glycerophosphodiester phosphodiesterase [Blautia sp. HCP3S3_G3]|uniref:glycerophosphodiester phosphodiesterase n=1 Tax=Blautia sp. HCP3S3_G3 TaxID=3438913 RepID=UPI003F8993E9
MNTHTKIFAHRGFSGRYPENTMLAFTKAVETGCYGIEIDVQLTKDGELVIIHDEGVERTTGAKGYIRDYTLDQIKELNASGKWGDQFGKTEIPTLDEYCRMIAGTSMVTNIELKNSIFPYPGMEEKVWKMIQKYHLEDRVLISSFNHYSLLKFKELAADIPCGILEESIVVDEAQYADRLGMQFLHPSHPAVTEVYVEKAREYGLGINTWTVNDEELMKKLIRLGVHGIITNYPDVAVRL